MSIWGYGCAWRMQDRDLYAFAGTRGHHPSEGFTGRRPGLDLRALQESWRETIKALYLDGLGNRRAPPEPPGARPGEETEKR